jgi:LEA14-like dessication related protein
VRPGVFVSLSAAVFVLAACSKPAPPQITPKEARLVGLGPTGAELVVVVEATNPNRVTLSAQSVTAHAKLDGKWELGTVKIDKPIVLPPNTPTAVETAMTLPWSNMNALGALATAQRPVPYVVEGTVTVGGESLHVDLPFSVSGTLSKEQIAAAALKSLQNIPALPGLKLP